MGIFSAGKSNTHKIIIKARPTLPRQRPLPIDEGQMKQNRAQGQNKKQLCDMVR